MPATRRTVEALALDDATLAGGARLVAAGGGKPKRITTAALLTFAMGANINYCGIAWDPDGVHFWHVGGSIGITYLRKFSTVTGAEVVGARVNLGVNCYSAIFSDNGRLIVGGVGKVFEVDAATSTVVATVTLAGGVSAFRAARVPGVVGKYWVVNSYTASPATCVEYGSDGNSTGRTLTGTNYTAIHVHPSFPGFLWVFRNGMAILKVPEASIVGAQDPAAIAAVTYTPPAATYGIACEMRGPWSGAVDSLGRLYVWMSGAECVDRFLANGQPDARVLWTDAARQFPYIPWDAGCSHGQAVALSNNDQWMAWIAGATGATVRFNAIRAMCVGPQTAVFRRAAATSAVTVRRITFPGYSVNDDAYTPTTYATSVGGAAYVAAADGADAAVSLAPGDTLDVKVTFTMLGVPPGGDPYIGGDAGEGVQLEIEDANAVEYPTSGLPASSTTLTAIRTNYTTALEALTPTLAPRHKYHRDHDRAAGASSADLRLFRWDSGPESEDLGVCDYSCRFVREHLVLTVTYPVKLPGLYPPLDKGTDDDAIEAVVVADAAQLRDALSTAVNYVAAQCACNPEIEIERGDDSWTMTVDCAIDYYRAQTVL